MTVRRLTQDDLHWLVCPVCHCALRLDDAQHTIWCTACNRVYPIVDGLPVLTYPEADQGSS